jgi:hypothetical protein
LVGAGAGYCMLGVGDHFYLENSGLKEKVINKKTKTKKRPSQNLINCTYSNLCLILRKEKQTAVLITIIKD